MYSLPSKHDHLSEKKMWQYFSLRSSHLRKIMRSRDSEVGRVVYCSLGFGPICHDKVQSVKLLDNNFSMSHFRNQEVTLHFLTSHSIRNNDFFQKSVMYRKLTRLDLPMISQENPWKLGLCLFFHLPCSWAHSHFWPGGRPLAVAHQQNGEKMAQLHLNHKVKLSTTARFPFSSPPTEKFYWISLSIQPVHFVFWQAKLILTQPHRVSTQVNIYLL